jgi:hypothetical protein
MEELLTTRRVSIGEPSAVLSGTREEETPAQLTEKYSTERLERARE